MEYFDLDAILCEEQKVKVKFPVSVPWFGFLQEIDKKDAEAEIPTEIPFWLAYRLASSGKVSLLLPKFYGQKVREDLEASAISLNLYDLCPYFYDLGMRIIQIANDNYLPKILIQCFTERIFYITPRTYCHFSLVNEEFMQKLDITERKLLKAGLASTHLFDEWKKRNSQKLKTSAFVASNSRDTIHICRGIFCMADALRKKWVLEFAQGKLKAIPRLAQIIQFMYFPIKENDQKIATCFISDKFHYIAAEFSANCLENFQNRYPNRSIPSLKGCLITLESYELDKNQTKILIYQFSHIGADNCPTHGDPINVSEIMKSYPDSFEPIDSLIDACLESSNSEFPFTLRDVDCIIPVDQQKTLDGIWTTELGIVDEIVFTPIVATESKDCLEIIDDDEDVLEIVDDDSLALENNGKIKHECIFSTESIVSFHPTGSNETHKHDDAPDRSYCCKENTQLLTQENCSQLQNDFETQVQSQPFLECIHKGHDIIEDSICISESDTIIITTENIKASDDMKSGTIELSPEDSTIRCQEKTSTSTSTLHRPKRKMKEIDYFGKIQTSWNNVTINYNLW